MFSFFAFHVAAALTLGTSVQATTSLRASTNNSTNMVARQLSSPDSYGFIVSQIREDKDWCLTVAYGTGEFTKLGFRKCNYEGSPSNQLFKLDVDGKIRSHLDDSKCMILNHGDTLFNGVRVRLADCGLPTALNKFELEAETDYLKLKLPFEISPAFCITNRGPNPHNGDTIHARTCKDRGDFKWTFQLPPCYGTVVENETCGIDGNGGCNSSPGPLYTPLEPCEGTTTFLEIQGGFFAESGTRDTDWYSFTISEPTLVTASVTSSTPAVLYLVNGLCGSLSVVATTASNTPELPATFLFTVPGEYVVFVAPSDYYNVPCSSGAEYAASLSFEPLSVESAAAGASQNGQDGATASVALLSAHEKGQ